MDRLTTDNPRSNTETMLNLAHVNKNGWVEICGMEQPFMDYIRQQCRQHGCDLSELDDCELCVAVGECAFSNHECPVFLLHTIATQAAELRARLKQYEDTGLTPDDIVDLGSIDHLRELVRAENDERCVVLDMPRKPLVWGDDEHNTCLCPYCGKDLMGIPYGERMVLQCPKCGQYLDATKTITRKEAEAALKEQEANNGD
jgi:hypothetical protein